MLARLNLTAESDGKIFGPDKHACQSPKQEATLPHAGNVATLSSPNRKPTTSPVSRARDDALSPLRLAWEQVLRNLAHAHHHENHVYGALGAVSGAITLAVDCSHSSWDVRQPVVEKRTLGQQWALCHLVPFSFSVPRRVVRFAPISLTAPSRISALSRSWLSETDPNPTLTKQGANRHPLSPNHIRSGSARPCQRLARSRHVGIVCAGCPLSSDRCSTVRNKQQGKTRKQETICHVPSGVYNGPCARRPGARQSAGSRQSRRRQPMGRWP